MIPKGTKFWVAALALLFAAGASPRQANAGGTLEVNGLEIASISTSPHPDLRLAIARGAGAFALERAPIRRRHPGSGYSQPNYFASIGLGRFEPSTQPGDGLYVSGAFGAEIAPQIDLGGQISWYHRSVGGSQFVYEYEDPAGNIRRVVEEAGEIDTDLVPLMATMRVRFPVSPQFQPYVGGGLGFEWLTVEGTDIDGNFFSDDYSGFGAQVLGGMNFKVNPEVALYGEAVWNLSTVSADFDDPFLGATIHEEVDFDGVGFHAGLRFGF